MPRKLTLDSLRADLIAVQEMIDSAIQYGDYAGEVQMKHRKTQLQQELAALEAEEVHRANVALFFGGNPVVGSLGINVAFAGPALERFQDIVSKVYANMEQGALGARGRVAQAANTNLIVTHLAKGSFGFVLEESDNQLLAEDTPLKTAVASTTEMLDKCCQDCDDSFEQVIDTIDQRVLDALNGFFGVLDKHKATIRLVDDNRECKLDGERIRRAKDRIATTEISENIETVKVKLEGFMPGRDQFQAIHPEHGEIYGVATARAQEEANKLLESQPLLQRHWNVKIQKRVFRARNGKERVSYKLMHFVQGEG